MTPDIIVAGMLTRQTPCATMPSLVADGGTARETSFTMAGKLGSNSSIGCASNSLKTL